MNKALLKHEVALIKTGKACELLEEALQEETSTKYVINQLQNLLRKHSLEIVVKGINAQ
jgi:hypothetical protein